MSTMPHETRSDARVFVSAIAGVAVTLTMITLTAAAAGLLLEALMASHLKGMRIGLLAITVVVCAFWTYVGTVWMSEDIADVRTIDRQRALGIVHSQ
jgi:hypothetical protein